mmetsp:Transcript_8230/g.24690  ORF Transcript_8230/g.24690 Transcript_8230/m.24690 type:complete len:313 (+) Transcript_8230:857-1795(+)
MLYGGTAAPPWADVPSNERTPDLPLPASNMFSSFHLRCTCSSNASAPKRASACATAARTAPLAARIDEAPASSPPLLVGRDASANADIQSAILAVPLNEAGVVPTPYACGQCSALPKARRSASNAPGVAASPPSSRNALRSMAPLQGEAEAIRPTSETVRRATRRPDRSRHCVSRANISLPLVPLSLPASPLSSAAARFASVSLDGFFLLLFPAGVLCCAFVFAASFAFAFAWSSARRSCAASLLSRTLLVRSSSRSPSPLEKKASISSSPTATRMYRAIAANPRSDSESAQWRRRASITSSDVGPPTPRVR